MVVFIAEEHLDGVGQSPQLVLVGVGRYLVVDGGQADAVGGVIRIVDDDLLARDVSLQAQSEQLHEEVAVEVDVEDHRVVVGLVGEEYGQRGQYGCRQTLSEPYGPHAATGHTIAGVVEDVIDDEHQHADDDGYSQSALADDGSEGCSDEEEEQAREGQRELVECLDAVLADELVAVARYQLFVFLVGHAAVHTVQGRRHGALFLFG